MPQHPAFKATSYSEHSNERRWTGPRVAAICACGILVTVGLVGAFLHFSATQQQPSSSLWPDQTTAWLALSSACKQLPGRHKQLCEDYIDAVGEERWSAAAAWRRGSPDSFVCAGISVACLDVDIESDAAAPTSACQPLPEGAQCSFNKFCQQGFCGGPPANDMEQEQTETTSSEPESSAATDSSNSSGNAAAGNDSIVAIDPAEVEQTEQQEEEESAAAAAADTVNAAQQQQQQQSKGNATEITDALNDPENDAEETPSRRLMASARAVAKRNAPVDKWPTAIYSVDAGQTGRKLSDTFLATSHEYSRIFDYGEEYIHAWANVFSKLSSSPIIRVGGASQDKMKKVPGPRVWKALKALQERVNARYIFGLPLWQKNAVALSKEIIDIAEKTFSPGAVIGYELGNEPEFWPTGLGGRNAKGDWKGGFDAFANYFHRVAQQLAPCGSGKKILSGPGWGNVNTQPHNWLARIMWTGKECGYMWEVNVHYYPYIDNVTVNAEQLLAQPLLDFGLDKYREYQRLADQGWLRLRISETNSLYGGGRAGLSDTMAGMFWVLDALCEMSKAGAGGFHLHWGIGGAPDGTMGQPNTGVQTNFFYKVGNQRLEYKQLKERGIPVASVPEPVAWPSIHAPWYAYLAWTCFAHGDYNKLADTTFVGAKLEKAQFCKANTKIHALKADNGDLRIILLNKDAKRNCNARIKVPGNYCKSSALTRLLPGPQGMNGKGGITWQGQTYDNAGHDGELQGDKVVQWVDKRTFKDGRCGFEIALPAASAALIVSKA